MSKSKKKVEPDTDPNEPPINSLHVFNMLSTAMLPGINDTIAPNLLGFPTFPTRRYELGKSDEGDPRWAQIWCSPKKSLAKRKMPLVSTASTRSASVDSDTDQIIVSESTHEYEFQVICRADARVIDIEEQPGLQTCIDDNGNSISHYFDFRLTMQDGRKIAVAIKPESLRENSAIDTIIGYFNARHRGTFADLYVVRSRTTMSRLAVANAETVLWARKHKVQEDVGRLDAIASRIPGSFPLETLLNEFGDIPLGFVAAINLMDQRRLKLVTQELIQPASYVTYVEQSEATQ